MAHHTRKNHRINGRIALFVSAGALVGALVSASMPVGPREARLWARLRELRAEGNRDIRISWTRSAARLSSESRAAAILEFIDGPIETLPGDDRSVAVA